MRKSPTFNSVRVCQICNSSFTPSGSRQKYCSSCRLLADKQRKRDFYKKHNPNAYQKSNPKFCVICGKPFSCSFNGLPYCNKHYLRIKNNGTTELPKRKSKNTYVTTGAITTLKTTKGIEFIVDTNDLEKVLCYTWCVSKTGYLVANINNKVIKLHRYLLELSSPSEIVDHINRNRLDNRRCNLRVCNSSENAKNLSVKKTNSSGYPGIDITRYNKYRARISVGGKELRLGNFETLQEAISARKTAERKYYGEFAPNF